MAKPKLQMVKQDAIDERIEVSLKSNYGKDCTIYINGNSISFTDGKANVLPKVAEMLKAGDFI